MTERWDGMADKGDGIEVESRSIAGAGEGVDATGKSPVGESPVSVVTEEIPAFVGDGGCNTDSSAVGGVGSRTASSYPESPLK